MSRQFQFVDNEGKPLRKLNQPMLVDPEEDTNEEEARNAAYSSQSKSQGESISDLEAALDGAQSIRAVSSQPGKDVAGLSNNKFYDGAARSKPHKSLWFWLARGLPAVHVVTSHISLMRNFLSEQQVHMIFRVFSAQTITAQIDQKFVWLIYVDERLPGMLSSVRELTKEMGNAEVIGVRGGKDTPHPYRLSVREQLQQARLWVPPPTRGSPVYLSTRLEFNEGIPRNAIGDLHRSARAASKSEEFKLGQPMFFCWLRSTLWRPNNANEFGFVMKENVKKTGPNHTYTWCLNSGSTLVARDVESVAVMGAAKRLAIGAQNVRSMEMADHWSGPIRVNPFSHKDKDDISDVAIRKSVKSMQKKLQNMYGIGLSSLSMVNQLILTHRLSRTSVKRRGLSPPNSLMKK